MIIENGIKVLAGSMILLSVLLTQFVHPNFMWLTVFVGANLLQSAFTGICPAVFFMKMFGCKSGSCSTGK
ncbi:YgaP family membrane protein [Psychromonas hadalis]|uniref:YgaP family membrane protein n=1 Tax=Psychromonas hadalis TaxID=211669 RepID=UPI0003B75C95|nr:DUF2892 domain-containing protein [Psychromonas hadalis]